MNAVGASIVLKQRVAMRTCVRQRRPRLSESRGRRSRREVRHRHRRARLVRQHCSCVRSIACELGHADTHTCIAP
eukprot:331677-Prymnesium_polylepis.1